jgi:hypothetical protein
LENILDDMQMSMGRVPEFTDQKWTVKEKQFCVAAASINLYLLNEPSDLMLKENYTNSYLSHISLSSLYYNNLSKCIFT